jgi:hypothetical protein
MTSALHKLFCSSVPLNCITGAGIETPTLYPAGYGVLTTDVPSGAEEGGLFFQFSADTKSKMTKV